MRPYVVSFTTDQEPYIAFASRLKASCRKLGLECRVTELPDRGTWIENVSRKGPFLQSCMRELERPLLWVDVDGVIEQQPTLLHDTTDDFGVHAPMRKWQWQPVGRELLSLPDSWPRELGPRWFLTGTVFVNSTAGGRELLDLWAAEARARPRAYQQLLLQEVWCGLPRLKTMWLPQGYCKIRGFKWQLGETQSAVILHDLASTQLSSCVRA